MNDLININQEKTMGTSEIAKLVKKGHASIMRSCLRLSEKGILGGQPLAHPYKTSDGQEFTEFRLNQRDSIILVAQNCPEFTAVLVDRWKELEEQVNKPQIPQTKKEWIKLALEQEEAIEQQQLLIEKQAPAVEFCNQISVSKGSMKIGDFAKVLSGDGFKIGQNRLFDYLRVNNILMDNNTPYQRYIDNGYFEVSMGITNGYPWTTTKITGKGQLALAKKLRG